MTALNANSLIEQRTGLAVAGQLRLDADQILREREGDPDAYRRLLSRLARSDELSPDWQGVIRAFAIGETYFFRDAPQFHALRAHILPALLDECRASGTYRLNIWCAGCATGEEPYSLAMLLHEVLAEQPDAERWTTYLLATDLNAEALDAARRAVYRPWSFRGEARRETSAPLSGPLERYFDPAEGGMQVKPFIRERVTFRQMNLLKGAPGTFDLIFCRHVLLYFSAARATQIEALLYSALRPGGWLFLGRSEGLHARLVGNDADNGQWALHFFPGATGYQRPAGDTQSRPAPLPAAAPVQPMTSGRLTATDDDAPPVPETTRQVRDIFLSARQAGDAGGAERLLRARLHISPESALTHLLLASLYADQKRVADAHLALDRALSLDALLADAHTLRGLLFLADGRRDDARAALQSALYCQRSNPLAAYTLGTLMAEAGDYPRALKLWEIARSAVVGMPPNARPSDLSDLTAGQLHALIVSQIATWR